MAELVYNLVSDWLDNAGGHLHLRDCVVGVGQGSGEEEVVPLQRLRYPCNDLLSQVFQELFAHASHGGHALLAEVRHPGGGEPHDTANCDLCLAACLLAKVHVD